MTIFFFCFLFFFYRLDGIVSLIGLIKKCIPHSLSLAGTTERVCLIQGTVEALNSVHDFIAEKVREMPQSAAKTEPVSILQPQTTVNPDRIKQVRRCILRSCSLPMTLTFPLPVSFASQKSSVHHRIDSLKINKKLQAIRHRVACYPE